ncbi:MAG: XkdF-like putative serine protease domain-containing protein [Reyranella sp.]|uniref:XkdF-like putative serine protease domain-containing protein n=1 Tax=Reyranella sp. TaxID=1929291 RepID=UPI003D0EA308
MSNRVEVEIKKADAELQIVFGEVLAPSLVDAQGDCMSAEEIRKTAYRFLQKGRQSAVDTDHDRTANGSHIVESFIARDGDPTFIAGSWVIGVRVPDPALWARIKKGELNGFSFEGIGLRASTTVQLDIPENVSGLSQEAAGHSHRFVVTFDEAGRFLGGETDEVEGHRHGILKGTVTEDAAGHFHRYSFAEHLLGVP